jgi:hypothetical protein
MAKRSKRREWTKDDVRELKTLARSKDASSKNREVAQADTRRNAAEGVLAWRVIGFTRLGAVLAQISTRLRR